MTQQEIDVSAPRPFAIITGASTGIGSELAKRCAKEGYDLLIAADEPEIEKAATLIRSDGAILRRRKAWTSYMRPRRVVRSMPCWLTPAVVLAVAFAKARQVMDTNITGTVYLIHKIGNDMRRRNAGRILIAGSIAGFIPSSF
jgi:uncharacterized protein